MSLFLAILSQLTALGPGPGWPCLACLALMLLARASSSPAAWLLLADLPPVHHSSWALPLLAAAVWVPGLATVLLHPALLAGPGLAGLAWAATLASAAAFSLALWLLPDTRTTQELGQLESEYRERAGGRRLLQSASSGESQ